MSVLQAISSAGGGILVGLAGASAVADCVTNSTRLKDDYDSKKESSVCNAIDNITVPMSGH
jgi:hypothetical protein